jgi:hypothetical protein
VNTEFEYALHIEIFSNTKENLTMATLLIIHWSVRWLIVLVSGSIIGRFFIGWKRAESFDPIDEMLLGSFKKLMILQAGLGVVLFVFSALHTDALPLLLMHAGFMLLALGLAILPSKWKEASPSIRYKNALFCVIGALVSIVAGVALFPGGWRI